MRKGNAATITRRLEALEQALTPCNGAKYVGRYYDELTLEEQEEYLNYFYNGKVDRETVEQINRLLCNNKQEYQELIHKKCKIKQIIKTPAQELINTVREYTETL